MPTVSLPLTADQHAQLLERYPHESNAALAVAFGLKPHQIASWACSNFVTKTQAARSQINREKAYGRDTLAQRIRQALADAGAAGLTISGMLAAMPDATEPRVRSSVASLTRRGCIHRIGSSSDGRWFSTPELAEAYRLALASTVPARGRATPVKVAPGRGPAYLPGEADASRAVRVLTPQPAAPTLPDGSGLFKNLGPGQYIDGQAKSWVAAITDKAA